jgi:ADP-ribose pyrophosphatase YjhB (NUDIX family)
MTTRWKPSVTVAAVIEREGRYLLIEEHTPEGLRLNNPAGHLEPGESIVQACAREALEETAHSFQPEYLVGVYLARFQRPTASDPEEQDITYLRFALGGTVGQLQPERSLDSGIVRVCWLTLDEIRAQVERHRSPLVLQCVEDHARQQRHPLALLHTHPSITLGG